MSILPPPGPDNPAIKSPPPKSSRSQDAWGRKGLLSADHEYQMQTPYFVRAVDHGGDCLVKVQIANDAGAACVYRMGDWETHVTFKDCWRLRGWRALFGNFGWKQSLVYPKTYDQLFEGQKVAQIICDRMNQDRDAKKAALEVLKSDPGLLGDPIR